MSAYSNARPIRDMIGAQLKATSRSRTAKYGSTGGLTPDKEGLMPQYTQSAYQPRFSWTWPQRIDRWMRRNVVAHGTCWLWTGAKTRNGYGQVAIHGKAWMVHRAFYTYFIADVPPGLDLDHLCRNRACVNPWHLEPVTRSVNLRRGDTRRTHFSSRTHCPQGHPYDDENTAHRQGRRVCRTCDRERARRNRLRRAA